MRIENRKNFLFYRSRFDDESGSLREFLFKNGRILRCRAFCDQKSRWQLNSKIRRSRSTVRECKNLKGDFCLTDTIHSFR
jgi:hypothetical protein